MDTKYCRKCETNKPLDQFCKDKQRKDGRRPYCKSCEVRRVTVYNQEHKEQVAEYRHEHWYRDVERSRQIHSGNRQRNVKTQETFQKAARKYREKLQAEHPEIARIRTRRTYQRKVKHPELMWHYEAQAGECHYCGVPLRDSYQIDHVMPLIRGGNDERTNVVLCCATCNRSKGKKMLHEWRDENWQIR